MTVKDILKTAATLLNLTDCTEYFTATDAGDAAGQITELLTAPETRKRVDLLIRLCNLVISELASSYVPMVCEEEAETEDGKIIFANLAHSITRVLSVKNEFGHDAEFNIFPEYIKVFGGEYSVSYEYAPPAYGLNDGVGFNGKITAALLGYGVASEYCVTQGRFEEAMLWRKRYAFGVERVALPKSATVKGRCWL